MDELHVSEPLRFGGTNTTSRDIRNTPMVSSLAHETLRPWLPLDSTAEVVLVKTVTDFHLGLNANRWLKIRMRDIADGVGGLFPETEQGDAAGTSGAQSDNNDGFSEFFKDPGLAFDPAAPSKDPPLGASTEFEHWAPGENTGAHGTGHGVRVRRCEVVYVRVTEAARAVCTYGGKTKMHRAIGFASRETARPAASSHSSR